MNATKAEPGLTVAQLLLRAAADLNEPFHESDLIIRAWELAPQTFGMRKYERQYPDVNRARAALVHTRGPVGMRYLRRVAPLTYEFTRPGKTEARKLVGSGRAVMQPVEVPPELEAWLEGRVESEAYKLWVSGGLGRISSPMALDFWGRDGSKAVAERLGTLDTFAGFELQTGKVAGMVLDVGLLRRVRELHEWCLRAFSRRLKLEG